MRSYNIHCYKDFESNKDFVLQKNTKHKTDYKYMINNNHDD